MNLKTKGFSLVELMVTVAVIIMVTLMILPNYRGIAEQFALERSANKLSQDIRRAAEMAMSLRELPGGQAPPKGGYGVFFDVSSASTYKLYADIDGNESYSGVDSVIEEIDLERNVYIKQIETGEPIQTISAGSVNFKPPSPRVKITQINPPPEGVKNRMRITLSLENDPNKERTIRVEKSGLVDLE